MQIGKDSVVSFHYRMMDETGAEIETSRRGEPSVYLHGRNGMMEGVEKALEGQTAGAVLSVTLTPEQAYGVREPDAQLRVPRKHLLNKGKLVPGQIVQVNTEQGARQATVVKVGLKTVDIDTNHPLADKTITFDLEVLEVRAATAEELSHGHVHAHGGCGH